MEGAGVGQCVGALHGVPVPNPNWKGEAKRKAWSEAEVAKLMDLVETYGPGSWGTKAAALGNGRTDVATRDQFKCLPPPLDHSVCVVPCCCC